jgi:hypothetical protein
MHNLIRILVFAKDSEGALDAAHKVVHEKLKTKIDGGPFDYYVDFTESPRKDPYMITEEALASMLNDNGLSVVSRFGKTRYGPIPAVLQVSTARFPADDKRGMEMVNSAMEDNRTSFKRNMTEIRYLIANYTDDQLFVGTHPKGKVFIEIRRSKYSKSTSSLPGRP